MPDEIPDIFHHLNEPSREALDALAMCHWNPSKVPPAHAARASSAHALLSNLIPPVSAHSADARSTLINAVIARVLLAPKSAGSSEFESVLLPEDEDAVDALFSSELTPSKVPASLRSRAERAAFIGRLVAGAPAAPTSVSTDSRRRERIDSTVAAVQAAPRPAALRRAHGPYPFRRVTSARLRDVASAAAAILLAAAVVWPMMAAGRQHASKAVCRSRLSNVAGAMGSYGSDFDGSMPMTAGFSGAVPWWDVGVPGRSNSANLFTLAKYEYAKLGDLACPGNPTATGGDCQPAEADWKCLSEVSYSYAIPTQTCKKLWGFSRPLVILADASPVVRRIRNKELAFALENSSNHAGQGQSALRSDGSVIWLSTPVVDGDNIWLPALIEATLELADRHAKSGRRQPLIIRGTEVPTRPDEVMLGP